jgi:hypothetical protein
MPDFEPLRHRTKVFLRANPRDLRARAFPRRRAERGCGPALAEKPPASPACPAEARTL